MYLGLGAGFNPKSSSLYGGGLLKARYWRTRKTNTAAGGNYHRELEMYIDGTQITIDPSYIAFNGVNTGANPEDLLVDGSTATIGFWTDTAGIGATVTVDFGAGNEQAVDRLRYYVDNNVTAIWDVEYSLDGVTWVSVFTGLDVNDTVAKWNEATWTAIEA